MSASASEKSVFLHAIELGPRSARPVYLDEACRDAPELRAEVEALLAAHDRLQAAAPHLEETAPVAPAALADLTAASPPEAGHVVARRYVLQEVIGEGGMGTVWRAEQTEPVRRLVAVKLIKPGMDSRQVVARFLAESQALALMDHPNIAKVLDGGLTEDDRPFFVMELVPGVPITRFCDEQRLAVRERLELFVTVCQAVQHAHQKGVIHRDLKPSNVLVAASDDGPAAKVIDFGVAKAAGTVLTDRALFTGFGMLMGTPLYMSPEQAELDNQDIDTRADVYSLGVLLYELLTGTTPLERPGVMEASLWEVLRLVREEEPPRPSARLAASADRPAVAARRGLEPTRLASLVHGELDWIAIRALEKDRNRRYATPLDLAADIQRYLADEPVLACPPSAAYRFCKFARRNRGALATVAVVVAAVLLAVGALVGAVRALAAHNTEIGQEKQLTEAALERERHANDELRRALYRHRVFLAHREWSANNVHRAAGLLAECPEELRQWEWRYLRQLCNPGPRLRGAASPLTCVAWGPDGRLVAAGRVNGAVEVWNAETGRLEHTLPSHTEMVRDVSFRPDGRALASAGEDGLVYVSDLTTGQALQAITVREPWIRKAIFSLDGRHLAVSTTMGRVYIFDASRGEVVAELLKRPFAVTGLAFRRDGRQLATGGLDGVVTIWEWPVVAGAHPVHVFPTPTNLRGLAWGPKDIGIATSADDRTVRVWEPETGRLLRTLWGHTGTPAALAFAPDGRRLASAGFDKGVKAWDVDTGRELFCLHGTLSAGLGAYPAVAFSPDGRRLATGDDQEDAVTLREARLSPEARLLPADTAWDGPLVFRPDGREVALLASPRTVSIRDVATGRPIFTFKGRSPDVPGLAYTPDGRLRIVQGGRMVSSADGGRRLRTGDGDAGLRVWQLPEWRALGALEGPPGEYLGLWFSPEARWLAGLARAPDGAGTVVLWNARSGERLWARPVPVPSRLAFSSDGQLLACGGLDGGVRSWDTATGREQAAFQASRESVVSLAFSGDGRRLATGSADRVLALWDAATGERLLDFANPLGTTVALAFSPDGQRLASTSPSGAVSLWEVTTGHEVLTLNGVAGRGLAFSPDGRQLAATGEGGILLWETAK